MLRQVRGLGTLVPTDIRWIPAVTEGRVERVIILPGTKVKANDIVLVMSNEQLQQTTLDAEYQLRAAEAERRQPERRRHQRGFCRKPCAAHATYRHCDLWHEQWHSIGQFGLRCH